MTSERVASASTAPPVTPSARPQSASAGTRRRARASKLLGRSASTGSTRAASMAGASAASAAAARPISTPFAAVAAVSGAALTATT